MGALAAINSIVIIIDGKRETFTVVGTVGSVGDVAGLVHQAHSRHRHIARFIRPSLLWSTRYRLTDAGRNIIGLRPRGDCRHKSGRGPRHRLRH